MRMIICSLSMSPGCSRTTSGGGFQAQNAGERPEFCSQTALRLADDAVTRDAVNDGNAQIPIRRTGQVDLHARVRTKVMQSSDATR